ncbi:MAG: YCF48-related protein, partial [Ignavibacteriae bacterium]|nr:YCF48-related protein [Ignavibacteriota bacterium]
MKKFYLFIVLFFVFCFNLSAQWEVQFTGYVNTLQGVTFYGNTNIGIAVGEQGRILKTDDGGYYWYSVNLTIGTFFKPIRFLNQTTLFTGGYLGYMARSTNAGESWTQVSSPTTMQINGISFVNANTGFITGYSGLLMKTINGGLNWTITWLPYTMLDIHMFDASTGIVCGSGGNILKTTNGGVNWTPRYANPPQSFDLNGMAFLNATTGVIVGNSGTILKTTNAGNTWRLADTIHLTYNTLFRAAYPSADRITCVGGAGTILTSIDGGASWTQQDAGTTAILYGVHFRDANYGCAVGEGGVILTTTDGGAVFVNTISSEIPDKYSLSQNYPNPFNPISKIKYQISKTGFVKLNVFDINGKEVSTLVNENQKPGTYEATFDGSGLTSGVYFYKL